MASANQPGSVHILIQFGFCVVFLPLRHISLAYYKVARRDYFLQRIGAMDWAIHSLLIDEDAMEKHLQQRFVCMMNQAWGNEDDLERLARYR